MTGEAAAGIVAGLGAGSYMAGLKAFKALVKDDGPRGADRARRSRLVENEVDALLVTNLDERALPDRVLGLERPGLVSSSGAAMFFTDPRYQARAADLVHGADDRHLSINSLRMYCVEHLGREGIHRLGIEATSMTLGLA